MQLYTETLMLLKNLPRHFTYSLLERETGIKESWLKKFATEKISNPGVKTVQKLHDYLTRINQL